MLSCLKGFFVISKKKKERTSKTMAFSGIRTTSAKTKALSWLIITYFMLRSHQSSTRKGEGKIAVEMFG
jgi:hypothetical protein